MLTSAAAQPSTGWHYAGWIVWNTAPSNVSPKGWICTASGSPGTWLPIQTYEGIAVVATDADFTLTPFTSSPVQKHTGTLTAARQVTLSTAGAATGMTYFKITRTGGGAFNLNVGTGPLKALATNQWCVVRYDGTAYYLEAYGTL
jgi:hypothetical protein